MITVVTVPENRFIFDYYLGSADGAALRPILRQRTYGELFDAGEGDDGTWIFTGLDRLTASGRQVAALAAAALADGGARVLNRPDRLLLRHDLLTRLHACGQNLFRATRVDALAGLRYPVFLREANQHSANLSPLLEDETAVAVHLAHLRLKGYRPEELLAVEFLDTSVDGVFRKYSAFVVDGQVLARHAQASRTWMIKSGGRDLDERYAREERQYLLDNPHREQLAPIFALAGVDYGRIDYALLDGRIQVWEINSAPTIGHVPRRGGQLGARARNRAVVADGRAAFWAAFGAALQALDRPVTHHVALGLPADLCARERAEVAAQSALLRRRALVTRLTHAPGVGAAITAIAPAVRGAARRLFPGRF
jgi:hypothetical protein